MNMTDQAVELAYRPERGDTGEVLRWHATRTWAGRLRPLMWLVVLPLLAPASIVLRDGGDVDLEALALLTGMAECVGLAGLALTWSGMARRLRRCASEYPEYRCTLTGSGMRCPRPDGPTVDLAWTEYRRWSETRNLFVLDAGGGRLGWIPKRAARTPADVERVREILAAGLPRL
ncbi:YcxB family protein [Streptomyces sp. NPDC058157]|uniref:YcxB family protein n=1 Tax=Streptomyces sp. NPDC058157 TaxID=3346360 RepID=UPI0036E259B7